MTWKEGDTVWIDVPTKLGAQKGKIVGFAHSPLITTQLYLIQLDDRDWPYIECRDALLMRRNSKAISPVFRRGKKPKELT